MFNAVLHGDTPLLKCMFSDFLYFGGIKLMTWTCFSPADCTNHFAWEITLKNHLKQNGCYATVVDVQLFITSQSVVSAVQISYTGNSTHYLNMIYTHAVEKCTFQEADAVKLYFLFNGSRLH